MTDWGSGYVTDKAYVHDYCRTQIPALLSLAALTGGVDAAGGMGEPLAYCDIGCGQGYTANLVAAANPAVKVLGVDFNPSHIANACALATAAGLSNVEFREASFEDMAAEAAAPQFDIMAMHGIYSWISPRNRRAIVDFVARRLKPGGLLYVSYDCMPGWAGMAPLRRIMARHFAPRPGMESPAAIDRALAYYDQLIAAESRFQRMFPGVEAHMEHFRKLPPAYLAHELLTRDWEAFSFSEVAADLAEAKLVYAASAYLTDSVDRVNYTDVQHKFVAGLENPALQEDTRDMLLGRQFRRDVFAKGAAATNPIRLRSRWLDTRFVMTVPETGFNMLFETAVGKLQLRAELHGPLLALLHKGPVVLRDVFEKLPPAAANWDSVTDIIKLLVGRGDLQPALPAEADGARAASSRAFNDAVLARVLESDVYGYLASPVTGGGVRVDRLAQLYLLSQRRGTDPRAMLAKLSLGGTPTDGKEAPTTPEAAQEFAETHATRIETEVLPVLAGVGIV